MKSIIVMLGILGLWVLNVGLSEAYQEITVKDGGTLTGVVTLKGKVPKPKAYNVFRFPDAVYCGRISDGHGSRLVQPFNIGPNGEFGDVTIMIEGIEQGKAFEFPTPRIEAADCMFNPFITVIRDKDKVDVVNMDPVMHHIQAYEVSRFGTRMLFNVPLPINKTTKHFTKNNRLAGHWKERRGGEVKTQKVKMRKGGNVFVMKCGVHAYMESWGLVVDHPYFAVSGEHGRFTISDIPPGTYKVVVWHPMVSKTTDYTVTVEPNKRATLDVEIEAPNGRPYAKQAMDNPRIDRGVLGHGKVLKTVLKQTY